MKFAYHCVILSNAKDLITSTLCLQILHFAQNDILFYIFYFLISHKSTTFIPKQV